MSADRQRNRKITAMLTTKPTIQYCGSASSSKHRRSEDWSVFASCPACSEVHELALPTFLAGDGKLAKYCTYICSKAPKRGRILLQFSARDLLTVLKHSPYTTVPQYAVTLAIKARRQPARPTIPSSTSSTSMPRQPARQTTKPPTSTQHASFVANAQRRNAESWEYALAGTTPTRRQEIEQHLRRIDRIAAQHPGGKERP